MGCSYFAGMKLKSILAESGAVLFAVAITLVTLAPMSQAGLFGTNRVDTSTSISNRHGADDPAGHDAGDDRGRGRGRGRGGNDDNASPTPSPSATVDDNGHHRRGHGRG